MAMSISTLFCLAMPSLVQALPLATPVSTPPGCSGSVVEVHVLSTIDARLFGLLSYNTSGLQPLQSVHVPVQEDHEPDSEAHCPSSLEPVQQMWGPSRASTCPWIYQHDHDPNRYPSELAWAVCQCQGCLSREGGAKNEIPDMECRQVKYRMPILRRNGCSGGLVKYNLDWLEVPVACACMRPETPTGNRPPGIMGG
ncbi:interleukin-17D-like [Acanthaster planci]|uniref:Interleukin-17D-like n=1 Tax=Acanthaster planci TaxID=133434 RepID=A0A8B7YMM5_ACAPL|nr:interleukin-17D-like [Acanthaster planci]